MRTVRAPFIRQNHRMSLTLHSAALSSALLRFQKTALQSTLLRMSASDLDLDLWAFVEYEFLARRQWAGRGGGRRSLEMALSVLDLPAIYGLLTNSMSGDERVRKPAETALSQSENRPGFCSCLMVLSPLQLFCFLIYFFSTAACYGYCFVFPFLVLLSMMIIYNGVRRKWLCPRI